MRSARVERPGVDRARTIVPTNAESGPSRAAGDAPRRSHRKSILRRARASWRERTPRAHPRRAPSRATSARAHLVARWSQRGGPCGAESPLWSPSRIGLFGVIEGLDVLVARRGVAPDRLRVARRDRAHGPSARLLAPARRDPRRTWSHAEFPYGSLLTLRGVPIHTGRSAGRSSTGPPRSPSSTTQPAASSRGGRSPRAFTFGWARGLAGCSSPSPSPSSVTSIPDEAPEGAARGGARTDKLLDAPRDRDQLRGERRSRPARGALGASQRRPRGATRARAARRRNPPRSRRTPLARQRPLLQARVRPIEITVEARDNDPLRGPKWGKSAAITLIPPLVGEPEAMRYEALARGARRVRRSSRVSHRKRGRSQGGRGAAAGAWAARDQRIEQRHRDPRARARRESTAVSGSRAASERSPTDNCASCARGWGARSRGPTRRTHGANRKLTEDFTLALDSLLRRLDVTDATLHRQASRRDRGRRGRRGRGGQEALRREERSPRASRHRRRNLDGGGGKLRKLGSLGRGPRRNRDQRSKRGRRGGGAPTTSSTPSWRCAIWRRDFVTRPHRSAEGGSGGVESAEAEGAPKATHRRAGDKIAREQEQIEELARDHGAEVSGGRTGDEQRRVERRARQAARRSKAARRTRCARRSARCRARGASRTPPSRRPPRRASTPRPWPTSSNEEAPPRR